MTDQPTHGGKRPGAGRKPSGDQPRTIKRTITVTADEDEYLRQSQHGIGELWRLLQASRKYQEWLKSK